MQKQEMSSKLSHKIHISTQRAIRSSRMHKIFIVLNEKDMERNKERRELMVQRSKQGRGKE